VLRAVVVLAIGVSSPVLAAPATARGHTVAEYQSPTYAVGMRSYTFVDPSRTTSSTGSYLGAPTRTLPTLLLYPAVGDPNGAAIPDGRPIRREDGFPLIVFSHGFAASGPAYAFLLEQFVRKGYVIAAPTFPLTSGGAPGGPKLTDYVNQPGDVSFVITSVLRLARQDRSLRRTIDRDDVGVFGHSLGAITTLGVATNSCCVDPRIEAAVSFSGIELPFPGGSFFTTPTPPLMLVHGDTDGTVPYVGSVSAYAQAPAPKVFLTLAHAGHVPFRAPWLDPTVRSITDFLDGFLKHDRRALRRLAIDGNVAGVASVQEDLPSVQEELARLH
jgi:pimeloyl-ACP methyl ester carboxylesterase